MASGDTVLDKLAKALVPVGDSEGSYSLNLTVVAGGGGPVRPGTVWDKLDRALTPAGGGLYTMNATEGNTRVGVTVESYNYALTDGVPLQILLDPANAAHVVYYWNNGFTYIQDSAGPPVVGKLMADSQGRYFVHAWASIAQDAVSPLVVTLGGVSNGQNGTLFLPAGSGVGNVEYFALVELAPAPFEFGWILRVDGANSTLVDSYFDVQYIGRATSL